jgi:hypothetical protein
MAFKGVDYPRMQRCVRIICLTMIASATALLLASLGTSVTVDSWAHLTKHSSSTSDHAVELGLLTAGYALSCEKESFEFNCARPRDRRLC